MERRNCDDLGLKCPNNFPFCTADFYGDAARLWQPIACGSPSSGIMGMSMFLFTTAQWQELQRQALIYKHIMASVPVPPDLLLPSAARSFPEAPTIFLPPTASNLVVGRSGGINVRCASGSTDPEPGRCRRTDGKKWRCARDAAPDQKYCERHLHRGRPRSRKPVEQRRTRCKSDVHVVASGSSTPAASTAKGKSPAAAACCGVGVGVVVPNIELNLPFQAMEPSDQEPSECPTSNRQWGTVEQQYEELPNLNYSGGGDNWCPFLNPNLTSLDETRVADYIEPPRRFIDAWSSENMAAAATSNPDNPSLSCRDKLHLSTLTLSMSNAAEDEADNSIKSQPLVNWMSSDSPLGGPLAEVLNQSSNMTSPRDSADTCGNKNNRADLINLMGRSCACASREASPRDSPSRALVSSPSGVLQKALVSLSDSSSSSSPTFAAAASRSDFAFHWMNLNN